MSRGIVAKAYLVTFRPDPNAVVIPQSLLTRQGKKTFLLTDEEAIAAIRRVGLPFFESTYTETSKDSPLYGQTFPIHYMV